MGSVFGKETVAEPPFKVMLERPAAGAETTYQLRQYGERFVAEAMYSGDDNSPFMILAKYIGVFGDPQNEGAEKISMTAPVVMQDAKKTEGTAIAMTAPVMMSENKDGEKMMEFVLPAEYDSMDKIPKPTNPQVHIKEVPAQAGAVHRFNGSMRSETNRATALKLAAQLRKDGLEEIDDSFALSHFQFWGYNPPFTLPMFRRNEVWVPLTDEQAAKLVSQFNSEDIN